jgi:ketosteroid isomerase-like protein
MMPHVAIFQDAIGRDGQSRADRQPLERSMKGTAQTDVDRGGRRFEAVAGAANSAPFDDPELCTFIRQFEQATEEFINGNNRTWLELASHREDATIMGVWGAYERGWEEVGPRYDWAAARFLPSGARLSVEYLASGTSGKLAYTVAIERSEPLIVGENRPRRQELRVTHVFCKQDGRWKFVHRQADPLIAKTTPASVLRL